MIHKLLVANRGEIACRVMASARKFGIRTVAVYSDADAAALHVAMADEAVHIGPAPVADSYLCGDRIIAAARDTGAQAVHPGYGFLSENPDFVDAVVAAGLIFVGPPASAIRAMGLKDAAKRLMEQAGVPVVPGYHGEAQDAAFLAGEAGKIGYPVMIKARAGGGGKGMRRVERPSDFQSALEGAQREGQASFGDPAVLIEKYITQPRHIEIQVFGDAHGNVVHLFERDCSLQRRHQKIIEEAPAPGMTAEVRVAMGQAAVEAARAIGYQGAGTVEFIADGTDGLRPDRFWFMEMNTRLQVEHPVSEAITSLDFVALQLRIAAGEPLPFAQDDLRIDGHAFEARVYAENVPKGFLPATGRLDYLSFPAGAAFDRAEVRIDSGVRQGDAISPHYDPMIAKVIVHGPTRQMALNRLQTALADCHVAGLVTNLEFLGALARHPGFARGVFDTGLIARDLGPLTAHSDPPEQLIGLVCLATLGLLQHPSGGDPWDLLVGWRQWSQATQYAAIELSGSRIERRVVALGRGKYRIDGGAAPVELTVTAAGGNRYDVQVDGHRTRSTVVQSGAHVDIFAEGRSFAFALPDALADLDEAETGGDTIVALMPGLVKLVRAKAGQAVARGDALMVLEAMKMEHTLTAPRDGIVADVLAVEGEQVIDGAVMLLLEPDNA